MNENLNNQKNNCLSSLMPYVTAAEESVNLALSSSEKTKIIDLLNDMKSDLNSFMTTMDEIDALLKKLGYS